MKRIALSIASVALVGSVATVGSTGAFFTDTQTSAGNVFTAGSITLLIDHTLSTYNGISDEVVVSDPVTTFTGDDGSGNAVALSFIHPAWTANIPGATWIWATDGPSNPTIDQTNTFTRTFNWTGPQVGADLDIAADNFFSVSVNGNFIGNDGGNDNNFQLATQHHYVIPASDIVQGTNNIVVVGKNEGTPSDSDPTHNPAGVLFKLVVHGQQTFGATTLTDQTFWNFSDVKPQDTGRDVISIHNPGNDAWTCMVINHVQNDENTLTAPEIAAGDTTPGDINGKGGGELGKYLHLFLWRDLNGDGNYNPGSGETPLVGTTTLPGIIDFSGATTTLALHDSTTGNGPILSGTDENIGSAWCAGTLTVDPGSGAITCDGTSVGNDAQTDSTEANLNFFATQARNQPTFQCSSLGAPLI